MNRIKLYATTWSTDTAGVSPHNNMRTELFFKGCNKAIIGNACKGCFNRPLWHVSEEDNSYDAIDIANQVIANAPYPYVTIGGGEPTDQIEGLIELTAALKEAGFHIMVYTWKDLDEMLQDKTGERDVFLRLLDNIDMLIDGIYDPAQRLYRPKAKDGFFSSIGSANQTIWDIRSYRRSNRTLVKGYKMNDVVGMKLGKSTNDLIYLLPEYKAPIELFITHKEDELCHVK